MGWLFMGLGSGERMVRVGHAHAVGRAESATAARAMTGDGLSETKGLEVFGAVRRGTHCCHVFQTQDDVGESLLPFFRAGLEANELCLWLTHEPLPDDLAGRVLRQGIPACDRYLADGRIEIAPAREWYLRDGVFSVARALQALDEKLTHALADGYDGLRASGNMAWLAKDDWKRFDEYERVVDDSFGGKSLTAMCSYPVDMCGVAEVLDLSRTHHSAIAKRGDNWEVIECRCPPSPSVSYLSLTSRERQVFLLAADGLTNGQIAERLSISVRTVESHRASFMRKLGLRHQTDLVRYAILSGLVTTGSDGNWDRE